MAAQVDDLSAMGEVVTVLKVILGEHQALAGQVVGPVLLALDEDQQPAARGRSTGRFLAEGDCGTLGFIQYFVHVGLHR